MLWLHPKWLAHGSTKVAAEIPSLWSKATSLLPRKDGVWKEIKAQKSRKMHPRICVPLCSLGWKKGECGELAESEAHRNAFNPEWAIFTLLMAFYCPGSQWGLERTNARALSLMWKKRSILRASWGKWKHNGAKKKWMRKRDRERAIFDNSLSFPLLLLRLKVKVDLKITVRVWDDMAASYEDHLEGFEGAVTFPGLITRPFWAKWNEGDKSGF